MWWRAPTIRAAVDRRGARRADGKSRATRRRRTCSTAASPRAAGQRLAGIAALGLGRRAQHARRRLPASQRRRCSPPPRTTAFADQAQAAAGSAGRGGMLPTPLAALFAPVAAHTELTDERIRFDPVPVYIGPAPGWKGPALGARRTTTETAAAPAAPRPCPQKMRPQSRMTSEGDASAPTQPSSRSKHKLARHSEKRMAAHKPVKSATEKSGEEGRIHRLNLRSPGEAQSW